MSTLSGLSALGRGLFSDNKGPWGQAPGGGDGGDEPPSGGNGPWGDGPKRRRKGQPPEPSNVSSLDEWLTRSRQRLGGGGGGFPAQPSANLVKWVVGAFLLLWLVGTSLHSIGPEQKGCVPRFGRYSHTLDSGVGWTLPAPIDRVQKIDV